MLEDLLLGFARGVLMLPSLLFDAIHALGKVAAPVLGLVLLYAWPFFALRGKKSAN